MPKNKTLLLPENIYHIYNHANGWENLFSSEDNYRYFLRRYAYFVEPIAETYAYCLMPNHFHLLVRIRDEDYLKVANVLFQMDKNITPSCFKSLQEGSFSKFVSKVFGNLFSSYTQAYNKQQRRRGGLFIQSFKRKRVENENYFERLIHYIHNNPVHHGFVNDLEDWCFSSYNLYLSEVEKDSDKAKILDRFGGVEGFKTFHRGNVEHIKEIEF